MRGRTRIWRKTGEEGSQRQHGGRKVKQVWKCSIGEYRRERIRKAAWRRAGEKVLIANMEENKRGRTRIWRRRGKGGIREVVWRSTGELGSDKQDIIER